MICVADGISRFGLEDCLALNCSLNSICNSNEMKHTLRVNEFYDIYLEIMIVQHYVVVVVKVYVGTYSICYNHLYLQVNYLLLFTSHYYSMYLKTFLSF